MTKFIPAIQRAAKRQATLTRKLASGVASPTARSALRRGVAATIEHDRVLRRLDLDFVADVGANRGQFSLAVRRFHPAAQIVAFEPLLQPFGVIRDIFADDPAFEVRPFALASETGEATFHISRQEDSSSLFAIGRAQSDTFRGTEEAGTTVVAVSTLDNQFSEMRIPTRSLLKADVQGAELEVLRGAGNLLEKFAHIYLELSLVELYDGQPLAGEIVTYLSQRGFELADVGHMTSDSDGRVVQVDVLFNKA